MGHPLSRWQRHNRWLFLAFKVALVAAVTLGVFALLVRVQTVVIPLLFAFFVAYQMAPLVDWARRRRIPPAVSTAALLVLVVASVVVFFALFVPRFVGEFGQLVQALPSYAKALEAAVVPWLRDTLGVEVDLDLASLGERLRDIGPDLLQPTGTLLGSVATGVIGAVTFLLNLVLIPVFIFLFSVDYQRIVDAAKDLVPPRLRRDVFRVAARIDRALSSFVRGQLLVMACLAVFYSVGLLVLDIKFAIFIGVTAGVANLIPYAGVALGIGLSIVMALLEGAGWGTIAGVGGLFAVGNLLESFVLVPKIVGDRVGLSPLLVLVALIFWGELLGILGVLIAVPVTAVLRILLGELISAYRRSSYYLRAAEEEVAPS